MDSPVRTWSTRTVASSQRFDYFMSAMSSALWPVSEFSGLFDDFQVELEEASLGCLSLTRERITPHRSCRTRIDVERTEDNSFMLFYSVNSTWGCAQSGSTQLLGPGDLILIGQGEHHTYVPEGFDGIVVKCPATWLRNWLPDPDRLTSLKVDRDSRWGRVLSPMVGQLTPAFAAAALLPAAVVTDQLGTLLAMMMNDGATQRHDDLYRRIHAIIGERCTEIGLTPIDVADVLKVPVRRLHQVLGANGNTFAHILAEYRLARGEDLLRAPDLRQTPLAQIARQAGFRSVAHFSQLIRRRTGLSAAQLRGGRG
jgi:AraC family transcriptional regulator, positive regulator of tynA and feaB